ncbi:MAG: hypothetical protein NVSMB31_20040 [Vulcanimicrobiaceae bacterium]
MLRFHAALAAHPPAGFIRSFSSRTSRLPWLDADVGYEDWYLVADSAALDPLDAAAVDAHRRGVHNDAAGASRAGAGGLYRLKSGEPIPPLETRWFGKPEGSKYVDFAVVLDDLVRGDVTLWQRQMVLGPAPEYAAQARATLNGFPGVRIVHTELCHNQKPT